MDTKPLSREQLEIKVEELERDLAFLKRVINSVGGLKKFDLGKFSVLSTELKSVKEELNEVIKDSNCG